MNVKMKSSLLPVAFSVGSDSTRLSILSLASMSYGKCENTSTEKHASDSL